jgi:hypothetical protein
MEYEYLSQVVGEAGAGGHTRAGASARENVPGWVIAALRPVADGASPVRAITHPLGFTCFPLERAGLFGVCVHLWSPRVERVELTAPTLHAHSWRLTSYALFGRLENRLMLVTGSDADPDDAGPDDAGPDDTGAGDRRELRRMIEVRSQGDIDELRPTGRLVQCVPGSRQMITAGDVYSMPAGMFHSTEVSPDTETATVALGTMVPGVADCSLGPAGGGEPAGGRHQTRRRQCDAEQTAVAARIILDRLLQPTACLA